MYDPKQDSDLDRILNEVSSAESSAPRKTEDPVKKKTNFTLNLDLDSEYGEPIEESKPEEAPIRINEPEISDIHTEKCTVKDKPKKKKGCLRGGIYAAFVLIFSAALAYFLIIGFLDYTGIARDGKKVDVTVPAGASTQMVATLLKDNGLIDQPLVFRLYAKLTKADGKWQPGCFNLQTSMGYQDITDKLKSAPLRNTVSVLIPEGFTTMQIAERLEAKGVCTAKDFYRALNEGDYSDFNFVKLLSDVNQDDYASRIYKMEGYLFPDTYEFYIGSSGETAIRTMLNNFGNRLDTTIRSKMKAQGLSIDELVIMASIVQGEAASSDDMQKVSRVLWNRIKSKSYPKLQCDSTRDYVKDILAKNSTITVSNKAYDTYEREGLPVGAINNPGLAAIKAVLTPSEDPKIYSCFFFATDYNSGETYYSETYEQHVRICKKYGIGMYG